MYSFRDLKKSEILEKSIRPTFEGEKHPYEPQVARMHANKTLVWYDDPTKANRVDHFIDANKERFIAKQPLAHQPIVRKFIDHVRKDPTRHARVGENETRGEQVVRARHIKMLLEGHPHAILTMNPATPNEVMLSAVRHRDWARGAPIRPEQAEIHHWTFSDKGQKFLKKGEAYESAEIKYLGWHPVKIGFRFF